MLSQTHLLCRLHSCGGEDGGDVLWDGVASWGEGGEMAVLWCWRLVVWSEGVAKGRSDGEVVATVVWQRLWIGFVVTDVGSAAGGRNSSGDGAGKDGGGE
ncbi:hypothetical protein Tco_0253682, partial [Tanacetum coccineum]